MNKKSLLATLGYTISTFTVAVLWHVVLFEEQYLSFNYIDGDPNFLLGFLSILIQGAILSFLYPYTNFEGKNSKKAMKYVGVIGLFFWTSHVLAFIAKEPMQNAPLFFAMESFYLILQFGFYGIILGHIHKKPII